MSLTRQDEQPRKKPSAKLRPRKEVKAAVEAIQVADMATGTVQEIMTTEVLLVAVEVVPEGSVAEMILVSALEEDLTKTTVDHQDMEAIIDEKQPKQ